MKILPKKGMVTSSFDLCHAGHIAFLKDSKERCQYLIAALHIDPSKERPEKNKPSETISERYMRLEAIKYINRIIPYETEKELEELILITKPDILFFGSDWQKKKHWSEKLGIPIEYIKRINNQSTTNLKQRIINGVKV